MLEVPAGSLAVVTGASSGIGEAIARKLAARRIPLLLVARSADLLRALAAELSAAHGVAADALPLDLSRTGAADALHQATEGAGRPVDLLVNAAGFGWNGRAVEQPEAQLEEMLRLNVVGTALLSRRFLAAMAARRRGRILNVASTAAFLPAPYFAAYSASKAFVLSFTEALHHEAKRDGVTVTCLCPGYTRTRFHLAAGMREGKTGPFPEMRADDVAEAGLHALERGRAVWITHPLDRLWIFSGRFAPRAVAPLIAERFFRFTRRRT